MKEQLAGQMIDILNPGKVSKWKVRQLTQLMLFLTRSGIGSRPRLFSFSSSFRLFCYRWNIYVEIKTKTRFLLLFKFEEQGKVHTNYVLPGRLGASEVEELGEEEGEGGNGEEGKRSPGFHQKFSHFCVILLE